MAQQNILIVEDDKHISKLVKYNLEKAGFNCHLSITGEDALSVLDKQEIDLIILDIMLPKMDGLETCKRIKQNEQLCDVPVIMLTAKGEEIDRIVGLELGADDYIVKPFSPRELVLRIKTILKRGQSKTVKAKDIYSVDDLTVDVGRHKVSVGKKDIQLTSMEFKLLLTLVQRRGRVQSRDQLLEDVWELDSSVTTRTVDTHVKRLRQKLGRMGKFVETVRGLGYRLKDED